MDLRQSSAASFAADSPQGVIYNLLTGSLAHDREAWSTANTILTEITNGKSKDMTMFPSLKRAHSGGLQQRESTPAASGSDAAHEAAEKVNVTDRDPAPYSLQPGGLARADSASTEPGSSSVDACEKEAVTDREPAPYSHHFGFSDVQGTEIQEAAEKQRLADRNLPTYLQSASDDRNRATQDPPVIQHPALRPQASKASPGLSTARPHASIRPQDMFSGPNAVRAQASVKPQDTAKLQDGAKAQDVNTAQAGIGGQADTGRPQEAVRAETHVREQGTVRPQGSGKTEEAAKAQDTARPQDIHRDMATGNFPDTTQGQGTGGSLHKASGQAADAAKPQDMVRPLGLLHGWELQPGHQPPLAAMPDDIAAWDTPRLEQMPGRMPEPRFNAHLLNSGSKAAAPTGKADPVSSPRVGQSKGGVGMIVEESADGKWPAHVLVQCNGNQGKFLLNKQSMVCTCKLCQIKAAKMGVAFVDMTPTEFERHSGTYLVCCA